MKKNKAVAVSGMGCLCAAGLNVADCMAFLFQGQRYPAPPLSFSGRGSHPVFEITSDFYVPRHFRQKELPRTSCLAITAAREALADAGLDEDYFRRKRVGVCLGSNVGGGLSGTFLEQWRIAESDPYILPQYRYLGGNPARHLAAEFGISGPVQTVVNACSAGGDAIGLGAAWIRMGICDAVIAGGADALYEITYLGFMSLLNTDAKACKPFDIRRKGLNLGEGAGMMLLESDEMLAERDHKAKSRVLGYGSAADAHHFTAPHPQGKGLRAAMAEAMASAGISASDLAFINAHGTGTADNDRIESCVFSEDFPGIPFLSTKGYTGHTLGAAGAIEAVFTAACLEQGRIPRSAGFSEPDPELPACPVHENREISGSTAMSDTLAFGGNNAVLILGRPEKTKGGG
ncbi:MAG: beta-ketoacyl-[acyl-carrier-protein] synthase family protein [Desulfococcaceae bacterium]|jgi:3-oxoacyl-[acyl-carrier-protein] synthase-1/3-oxoacyl-[acyl-carrier-protein] synthase II|nr:beta-ketoacyl-[acyl-carrier-protein] synthase family protein [Desulfococcaceae bacterium]